MLEDIIYIWKMFYESLYVQQIHVIIYLQNRKNCLWQTFFLAYPQILFVNLFFFSNSNPDLKVTLEEPILAKFFIEMDQKKSVGETRWRRGRD